MVRPNSKISYFEFHIRKLEKRPIRKSEESIWSKLATPLPGVRGGGRTLTCKRITNSRKRCASPFWEENCDEWRRKI